jgi:hypothetical protein
VFSTRTQRLPNKVCVFTPSLLTNMERARSVLSQQTPCIFQPTTAAPTCPAIAPDTVAFTTRDIRNQFVSFYQPVSDIRYEVKIVGAGSSQATASYTVTVFGVYGLAYGPLANLGRRLSPTIQGPTALAKANADAVSAGVADALGGMSGNAKGGSQGFQRAKPTFAPAPTIPAHWGQ